MIKATAVTCNSTSASVVHEYRADLIIFADGSATVLVKDGGAASGSGDYSNTRSGPDRRMSC